MGTHLVPWVKGLVHKLSTILLPRRIVGGHLLHFKVVGWLADGVVAEEPAETLRDAGRGLAMATLGDECDAGWELDRRHAGAIVYGDILMACCCLGSVDRDCSNDLY